MESSIESSARAGRGMILGKFMPPHLGHQFLIDFGRHYVEDLTVLVCTRACEPIPGEVRWQWIKEMYAHTNVRLIHVTDDLPQTPDEHPDFWRIWHDVICDHMPEGIDYVFASEEYGFKLAEVLDAKFIPVDRARELVPVSATAIRQDAIANWHYLPICVRPHYLKRVCLFGPESTGKTTLAARLAEHFQTVWVSEHARPLLDHKEGVCDARDIAFIARGQVAAEDALARQANRVLICDTDPLLTCVWSQMLFGDVPAWLERMARDRRYDLYLLTDIDVPWVDDGQRYLPHNRRRFFEQCEKTLQGLQRPYVTLRGDWDQRFVHAVAMVEDVLAGAMPARGRDA